MQGGNVRASINVDLNLGDALGEINKLKSGLKQLKIPANATKGFENSLDNLVAEIQKFDSLNKSIKPGDKAGMNALEKSYQNILRLAQKVDTEMSSMGNRGKSLISDSDLAKMNKLKSSMEAYNNARKKNEKEINNLKEKIAKKDEERISGKNKLEKDLSNKQKKYLEKQQNRDNFLAQKNNKKLYDYVSAQSPSEKAKITNQINKSGNKQEIADLEKLKSLMKEVSTASKQLKTSKINLGNFNVDKISQEITTLQGQLKQLQSAGGSLDQLRADFASLAGVPLEKVTTDVEELNSEIKSLQSNKIEQLKSALNQLGSSSGIDKLNQDLRQGQQQLNQYRGEFDKLTMKQRDADDMKYRLTNFFSWSEGLNLLKRGAREAFQAVKDLDDAMTGTAVVTDFSVSDLWDMLPKYTETANKLGATVQGAYETMTLYYQQGLDTEAAFGMGTETMKMSRIADMDYVEGTDLMTAAIRGFHMDLTETSAKWVNDVYSELAAISASDTHEIATAMTKTASIADSANAEFDTTAAFLTQMIETTREAPETAGTALKTIIARFQELKKAPEEISDVEGEEVNANKIEEALKTIGVDLRDTTGQFRDFDDVILDISSKWDSLDTNTQRYIATIAAGARQQSRFIALVADNERLTELVEGAQSSAGASDKQFEKTMESLTAKLNTLKNAYHEFLMGILDSNIIKGGVDALTGLFNILNNLADLTGPLNGLVKVLMTVGMFMGGRALIHNGISAISGGLAAAVSAGSAAAMGAGATKAAAAANTAKTAMAANAAGKSGIGAMMAAMIGGQAIGDITEKARAGAVKKATNAKNILGALALGVAPDVMSEAGDKLRGYASNTDDQNRKEFYEKGAKYYDNKEAEDRKSRVRGIDKTRQPFAKRAGALAIAGADGLANTVSLLGAIPPQLLGIAAGVAAVGAAVAISEHIHQKRIDNMNELIEQHQEAKQVYNDNKVALESLEEEYNTLSKGVDRNGKNIGLSAEQYERYKEVAQEIADISPEVVDSIDIEGNVILKDDAIKKAQEALDFDMELQNASFSSETGLNTLIKGVQASTSDIRNEYSDSAKDFNKLIQDNAFSGAKAPKGPVTKGRYSTAETEFYGEEVLADYDKQSDFRPKGPAIKGYVSPNSYSATTEDLEDLYDERYQILSDAKEDLNNIAEEFGTDSEEYEEAVNDYYNLQGLIDQGGQLKEELKAAREPIIESLKTFATSDRDFSAKGIQSLADEVAKDNEQFFSKFIEDTALDDTLSATQMQDYIQYASEKLSGDNEFGKKVADEFDAMEEAKDKFDESARDTEAIEKYNNSISDSIDNMESYIQELRDEGTDEALALADSLEAQLAELESYAQEAKMTLSEAFNDMSDEIAKANKAKEEYDTATAEGDYYTGRQSFKEIYDDITSDVNYAGGGSQSFWTGAGMMLDQQWLRENAGNVDAVKAKIKSLDSMMQDGVSGAQAFADQLYNIPADELEEVGLFLNEAGEISFENFKDDNITALAEKLGLSADFTTAMLNNLRQFTDINFSNIDDVVRTMKDTGIGVETSEGKMAVSREALYKQSGMTLPEFEEWAGQESTKEQIILVDYQLKDTKSLINFRKQLEEIAPSVFEGKIEDGATNLEGVSLSLSDYIAASHMLGATQEEATDYLEELSKQGVDIKGKENSKSLAEAVEDGYEKIDLEDPLTSASSSMDNAASAMMALVAILGGGMDTKASKAARAEAKEGYKGQYDIGTKKGTIDDYKEWSDSDWEKYEKDKSYAEEQRRTAKIAMDNAKDSETKAAAQYEYDAWGKHIGSMENSANIQKAKNGDTVTIGGEKFEIQKVTDRDGNTTTRFIDSEGRSIGAGEFANRESKSTATNRKEDLTFAQEAASVGKKIGNFLTDLFYGKSKSRKDKSKKSEDTTSTDKSREESKQNIQEKTGIEIDTVIKDEDKVNSFLDTINGLSEKEYEIVLNALTKAAQGDVEGFMSVLGDLPLETQCQIISLLTGTPPEVVQAELTTLGETETEITTEADVSDAISKLTTVNALAATFAGGASASFSARGLVTIIAQLNKAILLKKMLGGSTAKGANIPKPKKLPAFNSMAEGGKVGPNGKGGMTLTGELGPEIVWLPDQSQSFIVGVGGPQMVSLPSNAVVYPHEETKKIMDSSRNLPKFGSAGSGTLPRYLTPTSKNTANGARTSKSSTGSGNSSKAGSEDEKWKNEIDWLYNLLEDINEVIRDREKLEHRYDRLLEQRNASLSDLIELQDAQFENLRMQQKLEEERLEKRKQEMREYINENADISSKYGINFNENDMTIEINWEAIDAITDEKEGEKVKDMIDRLEEIQDEIDKAEDSLMEIEELVDEIEARGREEYFDLEGRVIDALEAIDQQEIDRISEISNAISDSQSKLLDSIQKSIDKQRQERDNQKAEEDLGDMRRRLAYLRQDTSGMNALEIKQLEEQLKEEEEAYGDTLVDQKLQEIQDQNDEASEQRERQIAIMEEQLEWNRESGKYAADARMYILDARNKLNEGVPLEKTQLYEIISSGENWQADSWAKQLENWDELLVGTAQALAYLDNRENRDYMAEMQEWFKVLNDPNSSEDDKAMARSKIAILEKQRNQKIIEEGLEKIYPTTGTDYTKVAYESEVSNYMEDMQKAIATNDMETLKEFEKLRNIKLELSGKENEKTNFYEQALKAQKDTVSFAASGEQGYVDYMAKLEEALRVGDFDQAYYWELMRDRKIIEGNLNAKTTGGSVTLEAMENWNTQQQVAQQQQSTVSQPKKVSELWNGTFTITRQTTGDIVEAITYALNKMGLYSGAASKSFTDESYKALRKFAGISQNLNPFYFGPKTMNKFKEKGYLRGGLADYTGLAWLDGTPSKPELVLNARDTENFIQLKDVLADLRGFKGKSEQSEKYGDTYYDVQINVDKIANDYDVEQLANKIKKIIHKDSMYRNVNAINFLR